MGYVRSHKFCCCIPVRFGVFIMSLLGMTAGGMLAFFHWAACFQIKEHKIAVTHNEKIVIFVGTALYTGFAVVSLFGFIGCLARRRVLVMIYAGVSWTVLLCSIITGAVFLYGLFHRDLTVALDNCVEQGVQDGLTAATAGKICNAGLKVFKGAERIAVVIAFVVGWLIQLYGCHIIQSYIYQLEDEEDAYGHRRGVNTSQVNVMPVVASPLPASYGQPYPFTQGPNSYGK